MSDESEDDDDGKRPRRRPLSRSRKLGSRRRRGRDDEEEGEDEGDSGASEEPSEIEAPSDPPTQSLEVEPDHTLPVSRLPSPGGSGTPDLSSVSAPPAGEQWAKMRGSARRFGIDFSRFLLGIGHEAKRSGVDFNQKVVRPVSSAMFEAAVCITLLFVTGVFGWTFGKYIKTVSSDAGNTVSYQNRTVRPGQKIDESFFSQGFDTAELHKRASRVLDDHLRALRESKFTEAYALLSPAWKEQLSFKTFESGYLSTKVLAYDIGKVETLDPRRIRLRADLKVEEQKREKLYQAVYIAVLTNDGWRLDGGTFK